MVEVIPAIIAKDYEELKNEIALVRGLVPVAQIDISDGIFAKNITWPFEAEASQAVVLDEHFRRIINEEEGMPFWEDIDFELDLMVTDAVENFDLYAKLGARRIIFHLEAVGNLEEFRNFLQGIDNYVRDTIEIGVAINPSTPLEHFFPLRDETEFLQHMGNDKLSFRGVELDEKVYGRIEMLRNKFPELPIAVDIGVNFETAPKLVNAGATKLVAGSAIFQGSDIMGNIKKLKEL